VGVNKTHRTNCLVNLNAHGIDLLSKHRVGAHFTSYFADALKESCVVEYWLADTDTVTAQLAGIPHQTRGMGQRSNRHWSVVRRHTSKLIPSDERSLRSQISRAQGRKHAGWATTDNKHVQHIQNLKDPEN